MVEWLTHLASSHPYLIYGVIALVSFIEGPILAVVCGLILRLHDIGFVAVVIALMAGDLIGDAFWYCVGFYGGRRFARKFGKYFGITESGIETVTRIFHTHKETILFVSKITMGLGFALVTLITAGMVRIPFRRYIAINALGQFVWTGFLLSLGYFLGHLYATFDNIFGKISVAAILVIIVFALMGYGKYVRSRMVDAHPS